MDTACSANGRRQTAVIIYAISPVWGTESMTTLQKTSRLLMGPEQLRRSKTLLLYDGDDDD